MLTLRTEVIGAFHRHDTEQALGLTAPLSLVHRHPATRTSNFGDRVTRDLQLTQTG
jgi:hypothetical protein